MHHFWTVSVLTTFSFFLIQQSVHKCSLSVMIKGAVLKDQTRSFQFLEHFPQLSVFFILPGGALLHQGHDLQGGRLKPPNLLLQGSGGFYAAGWGLGAWELLQGLSGGSGPQCSLSPHQTSLLLVAVHLVSLIQGQAAVRVREGLEALAGLAISEAVGGVIAHLPLAAFSNGGVKEWGAFSWVLWLTSRWILGRHMEGCWRISGIETVEERVRGHGWLEGVRRSYPLAGLGTHTADHLHAPWCLSMGIFWPLTLSIWGLEHLHIGWVLGRPLSPPHLLYRLLILQTLQPAAFAWLGNSRDGMWLRIDLVGVHQSWATLAWVWAWALSALLWVTGGKFLDHLSFCWSSRFCLGSAALSGPFTRGVAMLLPHCSGLLTAFSS